MSHLGSFTLLEQLNHFAFRSHAIQVGRTNKGVTQNEPFFEGHFPNQPVMPGVLIVEAMTQAASLIASHHIIFSQNEDTFYLRGVDKAKFRHPVLPGHLLKLTATVTRVRQNKYWMFDVKAHVLGQDREYGKEVLVAQAHVSAAHIKGEQS